MKLWEKKTFVISVISSLLWSLAAHFYAFSRLIVSHDSLHEFYLGAALQDGYTGVTWKIALGRFAVPVYQKLVRGMVTTPWLIGILALLFITLTVYVVARIFDLKKPLPIFLAAGILITNPSVFVMASTFITDLDINMLAMLLSAVAVWSWKEDKLLFWGFGALCICGVMSIYASYLSQTVALVMIVSILRLLDGESWKKVLVRGIGAIGMILLGIGLYALATAVICRVAGVALMEGTYNSITNVFTETTRNDLLNRIINSYRDVAHTLTDSMFGHADQISIPAVAAMAGALVMMIVKAVKARISALSALLIAVLLALMPIALDLTLIASCGLVHDLMKCAFVTAYLLPLVIALPGLHGSARLHCAASAVIMLCLGVMSWQYAVQANHVYLKKELESQFTKSTMTRIMTQLEQREDYVPAQTTLLFAGDMSHQVKMRRELTKYWTFIGLSSSSPIQSWRHYEPYLEYMMGIDVIYCDGDKRWEMITSQPVKDMPIYPAEGSIQMIDDVLVIKVGPVE